MKFLVFILLFFSTLSFSQGLEVNKEEILLIPSLSFSYAIMKDDFLLYNNGLKNRNTVILPEVIIRIQAITGHWCIGFGYGPLQNTIELTAGWVIRIRTDKNKIFK